MITELDLELFISGDKATRERLAKHFYLLANEKCQVAITKSRPIKFRYYFRKGHETKLTEHDWDGDFRSAVGMGIARGFYAWTHKSRNPTNPTAFVSYVLSCIDSEIDNTWREKVRWKKISKPRTAKKLRYWNPALVAWIEDHGYEPPDFRFDKDGFQHFVDALSSDERTVFYSQLNVDETATMLKTTPYQVKKMRSKIRKRIETLEMLAA